MSMTCCCCYDDGLDLLFVGMTLSLSLSLSLLLLLSFLLSFLWSFLLLLLLQSEGKKAKLFFPGYVGYFFSSIFLDYENNDDRIKSQDFNMLRLKQRI